MKKNKEKTAGKNKKRNVRELSPVKFPFSDDEDSDDVVLKRPKKFPVKNSSKMSVTTKHLLNLMKKCRVRLPRDKDGRLLKKIHEEFKKNRRNKYPIVKIKKTLTIGKTSPKQQRTKSRKSEEIKVKPAEIIKKTTPAKVYVKFPLSTPNSNRKKKSYAKTPLKKVQKPKPRGYAIAVKRLNATPALVREFGKRFFMCYVNIRNDNLLQLKSNSSAPKKKLNSSVRFNDTVEIFGSGSSGSEDEDQFADPMPVSLVTAMNGSYGEPSTPSPKPRGRKKGTQTLEKKKPILTPAAKKNYRLSDEKITLSNEAEEEEEDDAEYIGKL